MILSEKAREILNSKDLILSRDKWFEKLSDKFAGKMDKPFYVNGICGFAQNVDAYVEPEIWVYECLENLSERIYDTVSEHTFTPFCIEYGIYGVHFIDKLFGAEVFFQDDQWYANKLKSPVGSLQYPDLEKSETWSLAKRAALAFVDADVKLPLLGMPVLSSALNIAVNLYGEDILVAMLTEPESAHSDLKVINDVIMDLHKWYIATIPFKQLQPVISTGRTQPPGFGQLCGCTTQLLSAELYEEFIAPLDSALLSLYPNGGMIHLCGAHAQHIPVFEKMASLRAIQLNDRAAVDFPLYIEGMREDQIIYINPFEDMTVEMASNICAKRLVVIDSYRQCDCCK